MKIQTLIILLTFILSIQICFGQQQSETEFLYETDIINCDDLKATLEGFFIYDLPQNADSFGYVIIYGSKEDRLKSYKVEQLLKNFIDYLKFDKNLVIIAQAEPLETFKIQFWIVPKNGQKPVFNEEKQKYILPKINKQMLFYDVHGSSIGACDTYPFNFDELYFNILENNKNLRGKIVIKEKSVAAFHKSKEQTVIQLTENYKIPQSKLDIVFVKTKNTSDTEYWLVPEKKK